MLVLSGIIVGGLMSSVFGLLKYLADPETQLASIVYWNMGSFSYVEVRSFLAVLPVIVCPCVVLVALSWRVNVLSLGEREARSLGVNVGRTRGVLMVCATLATAGAICIAGNIGWVGLVIPHFARLVVGSDNTRVLPASILMGGLFLLVVDTAARTIGPLELPISILTGVVGAPFYAWLLYRQRRRLL
jgi:iron complex transport system permease protein